MENIHSSSTSIKSWPVDERPREKLVHNGAASLSNSELLAIIINNGNKKKSAIDLAKDILSLGRNNLNELGKLSIKDLQKVNGIGSAKAISIAAALELGRRRNGTALLEKKVIRNSSEIALYLQTTLKDLNHEVFGVLFLNRANRIMHFEIISKGGITGTVADPRLILKKAIEEQATSIILTHNHPSGNLIPSKADEDITQKIKTAAAFLDIRVLDHLIVSEEGYFSFADEGMI
ncbi:MAG: DNA repair protein RadC [Bacteroidetes bacterium]|jgi:DNA repair protein RadC|nr:DNA repair protein RadC [Bacteroidota bacterium]